MKIILEKMLTCKEDKIVVIIYCGKENYLTRLGVKLQRTELCHKKKPKSIRSSNIC